jgi:uncharacterized protein
MSEEVARQITFRMREHLDAHDKRDAVISFHGGEPLLGGSDHLRMVSSVIAETFPRSEFNVKLSMQSNGLLFTEEIGDLLLDLGIWYGTSVDGPPRINDVYRLDHQGRGTSDKLEAKLELIFSDRYRALKPWILCVINPFSDSIEVFDYLVSYKPIMIDFLFPLDNHDRLPESKGTGYRSSAAYGEWLIAAFDHWWALGKPVGVRIFDSILQMLCGNPTMVESLGLDPTDLIVIETNGEIEGVDSLKSTYDGATALGFNVFDDDFDRVAADLAVKRRQIGLDELCRTCQECPVVEICGGGYLPQRYSSRNGFDNPSVFCLDLEILIRHIHSTLVGAVRTQDDQLAGRVTSGLTSGQQNLSLGS